MQKRGLLCQSNLTALRKPMMQI